MAKKRFGIDAVTNQALSQTMQMAKEHTSKLNNTVIPISRITLDSENPRQHVVQREDLEKGPSKQDPDFKVKIDEYEGLRQLSDSIQKEGLLHPITVFKEAEDYKLIAGERRFFASIIAKRTQIEARVFKTKPKDFDLKIIQWMENDSRKGLSLYKKLLNIQSVLGAYLLENGRKVTAHELGDLLSISRQLAQYYVAIISNPVLMEAIKEGKVTTLRDARALVSFKTKAEIVNAVEFLSQKQALPNKRNELSSKITSKTSGRKRQKVALGNTKQPGVARVLAEGVLSLERYVKYADQFRKTNWASLDQATKAFTKLVKILEKEQGV